MLADLWSGIKFIMCVILLLLVFVFLPLKLVCTADNASYVKERGPEVWRSVGFEPVGYEGYTFGLGVGEYGGAKVWWTLKKVPDNGLTYSGYLQRWGSEIHVYNQKPIEGNLVMGTKPTITINKTEPIPPENTPAEEPIPNNETEGISPEEEVSPDEEEESGEGLETPEISGTPA
jgi:hypothetical protein